MIELKGVRKQFETVTAVERLSFKVEEGDIFGIIGPNGAGKSTTIRMILGILRPDQGEITFDGKPWEDSMSSAIGYLPEERGLYKKTTLYDYFILMGQLKGCTKEFLEKRIDYWLKKFDLFEWKHSKTDELSKGMSQKVGFITAVLHDPDFIILDEPFSGLDPVSSDLLRLAILELSAEGKTFLFSTHIMDQAEKLCKKILLLNKGEAIVYGAMDEVKASHGKNSAIIEFDGDGEFLKSLPEAVSVQLFPRYAEVELSDKAESGQDLLKKAAEKLTINRFEIQSPSLHKIFVDLVGGEKQ